MSNQRRTSRRSSRSRPRSTRTIGRKRTSTSACRYYPSLSDTGRQRVQLDAAAKREFWKDLFVAINLYNTYDNRPPNPEANTNDVGIVLSIGWTY